MFWQGGYTYAYIKTEIGLPL